MFLTDTLSKTSQNNFAYSFVSEHSKHLFKTCISAGGVGPNRTRPLRMQVFLHAHSSTLYSPNTGLNKTGLDKK